MPVLQPRREIAPRRAATRREARRCSTLRQHAARRRLRRDRHVAVAAAAPDAERPVRAKAGNSGTVTKVLGTTPAYPRVRNFRIRIGRFFDADDDHAARRVAVLGAQVADALFDNANPIGRDVNVRGVIFEVIGVMEPKGVMPDGSDEDNEILVPLRTALRRVLNITWLSGIFVSVDDPARIGAARESKSSFPRPRTTSSASSPSRSTTWSAASAG